VKGDLAVKGFWGAKIEIKRDSAETTVERLREVHANERITSREDIENTEKVRFLGERTIVCDSISQSEFIEKIHDFN
jgi:hypothetical protein